MDPYIQLGNSNSVPSKFQDDSNVLSYNGQIHNDSNEIYDNHHDNTSFNAIFHEGYIFRNLIDFLKSSNQSANILFDKNGMTISELNGQNTLLNN